MPLKLNENSKSTHPGDGAAGTTAVESRQQTGFERFADTGQTRLHLKRRSVRGFSWVMLTGGGEFAVRLGSTAILARLISPEHFGLFMMVTAVTAIADQFRDLGLSTATIQRETITREEVSNLFWINAGLGTFLAVVVSALAPLVSSYFREPRLTAITVALATTFLFGGLSVQHEALLARQMRLGPKSGMRLVGFTLSSVAAIFLAMAGYDYWALVWREVIRSAFILVGAWVLCPWIPGRPRRDTDVRSLLKFGSGLTTTYILGSITSSLDRFLLGRFQGADVVGLYRQSHQLVVAPMGQLMSPLYQVALPGLSMLQSDGGRFSSFYTRIVSIVAAASMPLSVFLMVHADDITLVVLGDNWRGAATFIRIFAAGGLLQSVFSTIGFVLVSRGRSGELLKLSTATNVLKVALMVLGLRWGAVGVALGDVSSTFIMFAPFVWLAFRKSPVTVGAFAQAIARPFACSLLVGAALAGYRLAFPVTVPLASLAGGGALTISVFIATWMLLPGGRAELQALGEAVAAAARKPE